MNYPEYFSESFSADNIHFGLSDGVAREVDEPQCVRRDLAVGHILRNGVVRLFGMD